MRRYSLFALFIVGACTTAAADKEVQSDERNFGLPNDVPFLDPTGLSGTYSVNGKVDLTGDFFQSFGVNDRTCGSCHKPDSGWTVSLDDINLTFDFTFGLNPIFRPVDGANNPNADVSTFDDRRAAYSMLLTHGTIRVGIGMPSASDFTLTAVEDPYGYASASQLSLFRRPLPASNLVFIPVVMWDGRVTGATLDDALGNQANAATEGHAQSPNPLSADEQAAIVNFEASNFSAQMVDFFGGSLTAEGGGGGPENIASQAGAAGAFDLYDAWQNSSDPYRQSVYRGQVLFNTRTRTTGGGPCNGCHSVQNVGTNAKGSYFNVQVASASNCTAEYPLYTFTQTGTGTVVQVSDPGRALISGQFKDIGKFKVPGLRGLSARAPYFHNGSRQTLLDVVRFYEANVNFVFTAQEETDLVNFLQAL